MGEEITGGTMFESAWNKLKTVIGMGTKEDPAPPKSKTSNDDDDERLSSVYYHTWRGILDKELRRQAEDREKYKDYREMDNEVPEITASLDVTADFIVYPDNVNRSRVFKVKSHDKDVQAKIDEIDSRISFQQEFWSLAREALKYGDNVEEIVVNKIRNKVLGFRNIPIDSISVNMKSGLKQRQPMIRQVNDMGEEEAALNAEDVMHLSINIDRARSAECGKGVSKIEKSRLIYRQVRLMEEGVMISRISRANQNYAVVVDVGELTGDEALTYLDHYKKRLMRRKYIDPATGKMSWQYNPLSVVEDILVPTRQGSNASVIPLSNNAQSGKNIEDIEYFQNKLIYSTGVPKLLIGKEDDINSKSTSDIQYISFLRMIRRCQTIMEPEIVRVYRNMLTIEGVNGNFDLFIEWPTLNTIDEERKWKIELLKLQVASIMSNEMAIIDDKYIYMNILGMSEDEMEELIERLDAEEEEFAAEFDANLANAEDLTGVNTDEFDVDDEEEPMPQPRKRTKSEILQYFKKKLPEKQFEKFEKFMEIVGKNRELKNTLYDLVRLTNTKIGDF
jgi:hypothetical protein